MTKLKKAASARPIVEKGIEIPHRFGARTINDEFKLGLLAEPGESVFTPLGDQNEKNLRQKLFQHMKRFKEKLEPKKLTLISRMDYEDPEDDTSPVGFRIWLTHLEK